MNIKELERKIKELREEEEKDPVKFIEGYVTIFLRSIIEHRNTINIEYSAVWIKIVGLCEETTIKIPNMGNIDPIIENVKRGICIMFEINKLYI